MPKVIKKKPSKRKTVQEEEVKSAAQQAIESMKQRQKQVITVVAVVVAVFIVILVVSLSAISKHKEASRLQREASGYYYGEKEEGELPGEESMKKALELFGKSVGVKATPSALYYLGNSHYSLGEYEKAVREYERFADIFSSETTLLPLVYQKLASAYFKLDKSKEALETLDRLAGVEGGMFKDAALIKQAHYYEGAGEQEKAMEKYRELAEGFPTSPWSAEANSRIAAEKAKEAAEETPEEGTSAEEKAGEEKSEEKTAEP